jgi:hypothetical protein
MDIRSYTVQKRGIRLAVRLTARASRTVVDGLKIGPDGRPALYIRVAAPPVEGAANKALITFLSEMLSLRKSEIRILSGEKGRLKLIDLSGDSATILSRLEAWLGTM